MTIMTNAQIPNLPDLQTLIKNEKALSLDYFLLNANRLNQTQVRENLFSQEKTQHYWLDSLIQYEQDNDYKYDYKYNASMQLETELISVFFTAWFPYMKTDFTYNTNNKLTRKLFFEMNFITQQQDSALKIDYLYDTNHFIEQETWYEYSDSLSQWLPQDKVEYSCDTNGNVLSIIVYRWDLTNTIWTNFAKFNFQYNTNNKIFEYMTEEWDTLTVNWIKDEKHESVFDGFGYKIEKIESRYESNSWMLAYKNEYIHNIQHYVVEDNGYRWDTGSGSWVQSNFKSVYLYDIIGNMIESNELRWNDSSLVWKDDLRYLGTYDTNYVFNDLVLPMHCWVFTFFYSSFTEPHPYYDFDNITHLFNCMLLSSESKHWYPNDSLWNTYNEFQYYYSDHTASISENKSDFAVKIFPNPASDIVTLNIDNTNNADLTLNIYNVIGKLVRSELLKQNQKQINISDLKNGIYLVEIKSKKWSEIKKLIIQR